MQFYSSFLPDIRLVFPIIKEKLESIAEQNNNSMGLYGFCDGDLSELIKQYPMSLISRVCKQFGWKKTQIMFGGMRIYIWILD